MEINDLKHCIYIDLLIFKITNVYVLSLFSMVESYRCFLLDKMTAACM